ncbi:Integrase SAM-like N-terminal domain-containing protein, partial [Dysosmobacter welbionis]
RGCDGPVPGYPALVHRRPLHGRGHGLPVRFGVPGRGGRPAFAGSLSLRRLSACRYPHRLWLPEPECGGQDRLHRERGGN